jgi:hypothetical protein
MRLSVLIYVPSTRGRHGRRSAMSRKKECSARPRGVTHLDWVARPFRRTFGPLHRESCPIHGQVPPGRARCRRKWRKRKRKRADCHGGRCSHVSARARTQALIPEIETIRTADSAHQAEFESCPRWQDVLVQIHAAGANLLFLSIFGRARCSRRASARAAHRRRMATRRSWAYPSRSPYPIRALRSIPGQPPRAHRAVRCCRP